MSKIKELLETNVKTKVEIKDINEAIKVQGANTKGQPEDIAFSVSSDNYVMIKPMKSSNMYSLSKEEWNKVIKAIKFK